MKRRAFISLLGGAAVWPVCAQAQQATVPVVGFLKRGIAEAVRAQPERISAGAEASGYVDGQNVTIEYRWAEGHYDRLPELAADLVRRHVAVIVANTPAAPVAKAATSTIPVVFLTGDDPVANGLVASLNRPDANLAGVGVTGP